MKRHDGSLQIIRHSRLTPLFLWRKRWQQLLQTDPNMNFEELKRLTQTNLSQPGREGIAHHFVPYTRCWGYVWHL
ncbi:MAG TPA: hypothetical protein ACFYD7_09000 [Candidatus Wujingus californicus]|nr:hypothetical protein [Planctomycetota bacterium]